MFFTAPEICYKMRPIILIFLCIIPRTVSASVLRKTVGEEIDDIILKLNEANTFDEALYSEDAEEDDNNDDNQTTLTSPEANEVLELDEEEEDDENNEDTISKINDIKASDIESKTISKALGDVAIAMDGITENQYTSEKSTNTKIDKDVVTVNIEASQSGTNMPAEENEKEILIKKDQPNDESINEHDRILVEDPNLIKDGHVTLYDDTEDMDDDEETAEVDEIQEDDGSKTLETNFEGMDADTETAEDGYVEEVLTDSKGTEATDDVYFELEDYSKSSTSKVKKAKFSDAIKKASKESLDAGEEITNEEVSTVEEDKSATETESFNAEASDFTDGNINSQSEIPDDEIGTPIIVSPHASDEFSKAGNDIYDYVEQNSDEEAEENSDEEAEENSDEIIEDNSEDTKSNDNIGNMSWGKKSSLDSLLFSVENEITATKKNSDIQKESSNFEIDPFMISNDINTAKKLSSTSDEDATVTNEQGMLIKDKGVHYGINDEHSDNNSSNIVTINDNYPKTLINDNNESEEDIDEDGDDYNI